MKKGLPLIGNKSIRILILGSFPSEISLEKEEYYANKNNDFWRIMSDVYCRDLKSVSYSEKIKGLLENGVGLWDVYSKCRRKGSMDKDIEEFIPNDFKELRKFYPNLEKICFNGKKAGGESSLLLELGYETIILPSSSGANRRNLAQRLLEWKKALK